MSSHPSARQRWQRAAKLAAQCHQHQLRKDGATPYICHPIRVALTVRQEFGEEDATLLAAALLHDVIEDTTCDYDDVEAVCGREVATLVASLSKDTRLREDIREQQYAEQIRKSDWRTRLIKLADVYDNLTDGAEAEQEVNIWERAEEALAASRDEPRLAKAVHVVETLMHELADKRPLLDKRRRQSTSVKPTAPSV